MSDIVEQLRDASLDMQRAAWRRMDGGQDLCLSALLADQGADEIERLRARVIELEQAYIYGDDREHPALSEDRMSTELFRGDEP